MFGTGWGEEYLSKNVIYLHLILPFDAERERRGHKTNSSGFVSVIMITRDVIAVTFFYFIGRRRLHLCILSGAKCKYSCAKVTKWGECLRGEFVAAAVAAFVSCEGTYEK